MREAKTKRLGKQEAKPEVVDEVSFAHAVLGSRLILLTMSLLEAVEALGPCFVSRGNVLDLSQRSSEEHNALNECFVMSLELCKPHIAADGRPGS